MPGSNARVLAKGPTLAADAIIIDLEDAVAPEAKSLARDLACHALINQDYGYRLRALRINAADTPWYDQDVAVLAQCRPDAVVLPKVESAADIVRLSSSLDQLAGDQPIAIWAMMESPMAVINASEIAACSHDYPRLTMWLVGNNDLARSAGMSVPTDRSYLLPWLMTLLVAAKAYSLPILDGVYNDFADLAGLRRECEQGRQMGMDGKSLIHPSQIDIANTGYSPTDAEITQAMRVVEAFELPENSEAGVLQINGQMVERLHLQMAQALLARAQALLARQ